MKQENQEQRFQKWHQIFQEQERSGLSQKAFCEQHNVVLSKFLIIDTWLIKKIRYRQISRDHFCQLK